MKQQNLKGLYEYYRKMQVAIDKNNVLWFRQMVSDSRHGQHWSTWTTIDLDPRHWYKIDVDSVRISVDEERTKDYGKVDGKLASALNLIVK